VNVAVYRRSDRVRHRHAVHESVLARPRSDPNFGDSLTVDNAASAHYPLVMITVTALVLLPIVFLYQGSTHHVLRRPLRPGSPAREITP
jgi:cytochrome bd-type quinol oxidase subunit 2